MVGQTIEPRPRDGTLQMTGNTEHTLMNDGRIKPLVNNLCRRDRRVHGAEVKQEIHAFLTAEGLTLTDVRRTLGSSASIRISDGRLPT